MATPLLDKVCAGCDQPGKYGCSKCLRSGQQKHYCSPAHQKQASPSSSTASSSSPPSPCRRTRTSRRGACEANALSRSSGRRTRGPADSLRTISSSNLSFRAPNTMFGSTPRPVRLISFARVSSGGDLPEPGQRGDRLPCPSYRRTRLACQHDWTPGYALHFSSSWRYAGLFVVSAKAC